MEEALRRICEEGRGVEERGRWGVEGEVATCEDHGWRGRGIVGIIQFCYFCCKHHSTEQHGPTLHQRGERRRKFRA